MEETAGESGGIPNLADGKTSKCRIHYHFIVPFGCDARLVLPGQEERNLTAGEYDFTCLQEV